MGKRFGPFIVDNYDYVFGATKTEEAVNPRRRAEKAEILRLGFKSKKAYRKWQKAERCRLKGQNRIDELERLCK